MSPRPIVPLQSVPVSTVPAPRMVKHPVSVQHDRGGRRCPRPDTDGRTRERRHDVGDALPRPGRAGHHLRAGKETPGGAAGSRRVAPVALRDRHHAVHNAERAQHGRVLARLRHDAVVGGDRHQIEVDPGRTGDHGANEALVTGNVDDREAASIGQLERCVAELDRHPASALRRQAIRLDAGERSDQ